jgi:hypothetical protein
MDDLGIGLRLRQIGGYLDHQAAPDACVSCETARSASIA